MYWNTWLLRPRAWPGGPSLPFSDRLFAPDVTERAPLVGQALAGSFDVCALAEVFDPHEQDAVAVQWEEAEFQPGPQASFPRSVGSGLMTVVDPTTVEVVATESHRFHAGGDLRDSDTYATKGALLTRVRNESGAELDVVSTHLLAGGEWLPIPGAEDHARHHRARMAQVDELVRFVLEHRSHQNPLLLLGDFNVAEHDARTPDDPTARYRDLVDHLAPLGVVDLWAELGVGPGPTSSFTSPADLAADPAVPDAALDTADGPRAGDRIDYIWATEPGGRAGTNVEFDRPRRWTFPGRPARGGPAGGLSDHLALSVTVHLGR